MSRPDADDTIPTSIQEDLRTTVDRVIGIVFRRLRYKELCTYMLLAK